MSGVPNSIKQLGVAARDARTWLLGSAAPLWSTAGRTASGLYAERLKLDGTVEHAPFRTFVQARHIFSFVEMGKMGWDGPWREQVVETAETLIVRARRPDGLFVHSLAIDGTPLDRRWDLYDQGFLLLGLAKTAEVSGDERWIDHAEDLLTRIENIARDNGGFCEGEIVDLGVRRQNPHMHLFEGLLALADISGRDRFRAKAMEMAELCQRRLLDPATGALLEYFNDDWSPATGAVGKTVEPGHCFEWAWLFERLAAGGISDATGVSDRLCDFARRHGLAHGDTIAINEVSIDGTVLDPVARLWPQTERLKAGAARFRRLGSESELAEIVQSNAGLKRYLDPFVPGSWRDKLRNDGSWIEEFVPGSSLYHICCAYAELHHTSLTHGALEIHNAV